MPLIVVGADTDAGAEILDEIGSPDREVRVFVTDESQGQKLKGRGYKVAIGDVSDDSHVGAAALRCFTAVLIAEAADDSRERSFARSPGDVMEGWAEAVANAGVARVIWVAASQPPETDVDEVTSVDPRQPDLARTVVALDDAETLT